MTGGVTTRFVAVVCGLQLSVAMQYRLAELAREAEEATEKVRALTDRTARHAAEVEALVSDASRMLRRAAAVLAAERERTKSGVRAKVTLPEPGDAEASSNDDK
jgi:hypothetical protein